MQNRRILILTAALTACMLTVSACGTAETSTSADTQVTSVSEEAAAETTTESVTEDSTEETKPLPEQLSLPETE